MPSNQLDTIIPSAIGAHSRSQDHAGAQSVLVFVVYTALGTAMTAGLFTTTVAEGAAPSDVIQWVIEELRRNGYTVTTSTTNLVISW